LAEHTKPYNASYVHSKLNSGYLSPALAKAASRSRLEASKSSLNPSESQISPKSSFLPALHKKTHFQAATALMMQYPKNATCLAFEDSMPPPVQSSLQGPISIINEQSKTTLNLEHEKKPKFYLKKGFVDEFEEFGLDRESEHPKVI
jgi:hypothetical protein